MTVRFGIIGCGMISKFHAKALQDLEQAELVGAASRSKSSAVDFAETHGIQAFQSIDALIQSKETHGKYYSFLAFFFGVPMGNKKTGKIEKCDNKMLKKIGREVKLARIQPYTSNVSVLYKAIQGLLISVAAIALGYVMIYKQTAGKIWKIFKNEYKNASMGSGGIS